MPKQITPTGRERFFEKDEIIVSKTDLKGRITYANRTFLKVAGYTEREVMGEPHSIVRHPDMPRSVFKLLWDTLGAGQECFAYVVNLAKTGDHYWVLAHVTPSLDSGGKAIGYHSSRRVPDRRVVDEVIRPLYADLLAIEAQHGNRKEGMQAAFDTVVSVLNEKGMGYDQFVFSL
ncbi:MAG: PAS domain-containing protein [Rhodospirillales bacterium]